MDDDKLRKALGLDWQDKLMQPHKKIQEMSTAMNKIMETENRMKQAMGISNAQNFINTYTPPKNTWDYLTAPSSKTHLMYNAIAEQANKVDYAAKMLMGGHTLSVLAQFEQKQAESEKALALINGIKDTVMQHSSSFLAFLNTSEKISNALYPNKSIAALYGNSNILTATNFIENKKLSPFDILSGTTFSNLVNLHESTTGRTFDYEIENLNTELINNPEVKSEVEDLVKNVNKITERTYKKIEEYLTDWIDKVAIKLGISKQQSYFLAMTIIFIAAVYNKELILPKKSQPTINITNNITIQGTKKNKQTAITVKQAPVYEKNHSTSRKLGKIKENTEVEIQRMKEGWCFIKGVVSIIKKEGKNKIEKDTTIQCWINQRYLSNFQ
jgi:hypothetical protein